MIIIRSAVAEEAPGDISEGSAVGCLLCFYADFFDDRYRLLHMHASGETGERLSDERVLFERWV